MELQHVSVMGDRPLGPIDLSVGEGDAVVVLGLPGAGKTSLLRLLCGLDFPSAGTFKLFGGSVETLGYFRLRALFDRVAVVFDRGGIWANRTVVENIVLPMAYRLNRSVVSLVTDPRFDMLLEAFELRQACDATTMSLDESEKRRILWARALYTNPDVLLVDEAQNGISRAHARSIAQLLADERRKRNMTIVYTDADGRIAPFEADRPVVMHERRLIPGAVRLPEASQAAPGTVEGCP